MKQSYCLPPKSIFSMGGLAVLAFSHHNDTDTGERHTGDSIAYCCSVLGHAVQHKLVQGYAKHLTVSTFNQPYR